MPELPEVETMRRGIAVVVGSRIRQASRTRCRLEPIQVRPAVASFRRRTQGRLIQAVDRLGKRVVVVLEDQQRILFEPRMTGLVLVADPPNQAHLRFRIELEGNGPGELLYWDRRGLGSVTLLSDPQYRHLVSCGKIGPDALQLSPGQFRERLSASRSPIKVRLLDQRAVAGIGNLYASEILHRARIHPGRAAHSLREDDWAALHEAALDVLHAAILSEGSTLGDGTYRNALNQAGNYQSQHLVYDKSGEICPSCATGRLVRIVQAQRSTFYCPRCQPLKRRPR